MSEPTYLSRGYVCSCCDHHIDEEKGIYPDPINNRRVYCQECAHKPVTIQCQCCGQQIVQCIAYRIQENKILCDECGGNHVFWAVSMFLKGTQFFTTQREAEQYMMKNWETVEFDCYYSFSSPFNWDEFTGENFQEYASDLFLANHLQKSDNNFVILDVVNIKQ